MDDPSKPASWFDRLLNRFTHEPEDREELREQLHAAFERNLMDAEALSMIEGVLSFSEQSVRDVMVQRSQITVLKLEDSIEKWLPQLIETGHSRFPVIGDDKDDIKGILLAKDLLHYFHQPDAFDVKKVLRPVVFVPESKPLNALLRDFRASKTHMAIVVDEYGGVSGLVTIEDVLEEIVGEIEDEFDIPEDEGDIFALADNSYRVAGDATIDHVSEEFGTVLQPPGDGDMHFDTIGGLIAHELGHVPKRGEQIHLGGLEFTVLHTKGGAVRWFKVVRGPSPDSLVRN